MRALLFVLASLLFSCGKDGSKATVNPGSSLAPATSAMSAEPEHLTQAAGELLLRSDVIRCGEANPADCPGAVGLLLMKLKDGTFSQCTTFLVAPDVAITNSHCIPEDLKTSGSSCRDRGWLAFPALPGQHTDQAKCSDVLVASTLPTDKSTARDFAVIRLASRVIGRAPLMISREGLPDRASLRLTKVDPATVDGQPSVLRNILCKAVHRSSLIPHSDDDLADNMILGDCSVVHGNSGSPILDGNGNVRGVIQATYDPKDLDGQLATNKIALFDSSFAALGGATNFACLPFPSTVPAPALPPACASRAPGEELTKTLTDKANALLQAKFEAAESTLPPVFGWTTEEQSQTKIGHSPFLAVPACVADPAALTVGERNVTLPSVELISGADRYFIQDVKANSLEPVVATLKANPSGAVEIRRAGEILFSKTLAACDN